MISRSSVALALTLALWLAGTAAWAVPEVPDSDDPVLVAFEIEAPPELSDFAERLAKWEPRRLSRFALLLGLKDSDSPIAVRVVLAKEESARELGAPFWVAGYARGDSGTVVLFPSRVPDYPYRSLEELLGHEVAHLMIHRASRGRSLPRWFHEGLAMLAEEAWGLEDRSRVALAVFRRRRADLSDLDRRFNHPEQVKRAYALSGAFVRDLVNQHGSAWPADVLRGVASGGEFEAAFEAATGQSLGESQESFWSRFTFWYRWLPLLTSSTAFWLLIVAIALLAARRRRQRTKELERRWEREEDWLAESARMPAGSLADDDSSEPVN